MFNVYPDTDGLFQDGTQALPGIAYRNQPSSGFWRIGDGLIGVSGAGTEVVRFSAPGGLLPQLLAAAGSAVAPSLSFTIAATTGIYATATPSLGVTVGGTLRWFFQSTQLRAAGSMQIAQDTANTPIGMYSFVTTGNVSAGFTFANGITATTSFAGNSGTQRGVDFNYTLNQSATAGFSALQINLTQIALGSGSQRFISAAIGGVEQFAVTSDAAMPGQALAAGGSAARPGWSFVSDPSMGISRGSASSFVVSFSGVGRYQFSNTGITNAITSQNFTFACSGTQARWTILGRMDGTTAANAFPSLLIAQQASLPFIGASQPQKHVEIDSVINQTGTSSFASLLIDQVQTALGSGAQRFISFTVAGTEVAALTSGAGGAGPRLLVGDGAGGLPSLGFLSGEGSGGTGFYSQISDIAVLIKGTKHSYFEDGVGYYPDADNSISLGILGKRWSNLYAATTTIGDLIMRDPHPEGKKPEEIAHWVLIEGLDGIFAHNIRTGKKYRISMETEVQHPADIELLNAERAKYASPQA